MSEQASGTPRQATCPLCGAPAEAGHLVTYQMLQWFQGEYGVWKDMFRGFGTDDMASIFGLGGRVGTVSPAQRIYLTGVRCEACRRIVLEVPVGGFDDGGKKQDGGSQASES